MSDIRVAFQNIQGGKANIIKWSEMLQNCINDNISVMGIIETNLKITENIPIHDIIETEKWKWHNGNIENEGRGGIGILWDSSKIKLRVISTSDNTIWVKIEPTNIKPMLLCLVYLKPGLKNYMRNAKIMNDILMFITKHPNEKIIIMGDFNAHVRELHTNVNANGGIMENFILKSNFIIGNKTRKFSGGHTWHSSTKQSIIDWFMYNHKIDKIINNIINDEDGLKSVGSDHNRQMIIIQTDHKARNNKIKTFINKNNIRWEINEETESTFQNELRDMINREVHLNIPTNGMIKIAAQKSLIKINQENQKYRTKNWWDEDLHKQIRIRKQLCAEHRYAKKRGLEPKIVKDKWELYKEQKYKIINMKKDKIGQMNQRLFKDISNDSGNKTQKMWKYIHKLQISNKHNIKRDNNRHKSQSIAQIAKFKSDIKMSKQNLTYCATNPISSILPTNHNQLSNSNEIEITELEVEKAIKSLRNNKAQGHDNLNAEIYKILNKDTRKLLAIEFNKMIREKQYENNFKLIKIKLIKQHNGKIRPISIININRKIFTIIIKNRLDKWIAENDKTHLLQFGAIKNRQITDAIYIITEAINIAKAQHRNILVTFIDFIDAYINVNREKLWSLMVKLGIPISLISIIKDMYEESLFQIECDGCLSEVFDSCRGLLQGCVLSALLFNIYVSPLAEAIYSQKSLGFPIKCQRLVTKHVTTNTPNNNSVTITDHIVGAFYLDDVAVVTETYQNMYEMLQICKQFSKDYELPFNLKKTKIMVWHNSNQTMNQTHDIRGMLEDIEMVNCYKYLGVTLINDNDDIFRLHKKNLIKKAEQLTNMAIVKGRSTCNSYYFIKTIWKSMIIPVLTYANQIICFDPSEIKILENLQIKVARQALGANSLSSNMAAIGDFGVSSFYARNAIAKMYMYDRLNLMEVSQYPSIIFQYVNRNSFKTPWTKVIQNINIKHRWFPTKSYLSCTPAMLSKINKDTIRNKENEIWYKKVVNKNSLKDMYAVGKETMGHEPFFDGSLASHLLFRARSNSLPTNVRCSPFSSSSTSCSLCGYEDEDVPHVILSCVKLPFHFKNVAPKESKAELLERLGFTNENSLKIGIAKSRLILWHKLKFR